MKKLLLFLIFSSPFISLAQTETWQSVGDGLESPSHLIIYKDELYAAGQHATKYYISSSGYLRKWDGKEWTYIDLDSLKNHWGISSMATDDSCLYVAASKAWGIDKRRSMILKYNGSNWEKIMETDDSTVVTAIQWFNGELYAGCARYRANYQGGSGFVYSLILKLVNGQVVHTGTTADMFIQCFLEKEGRLYMGGDFEKVDNVTCLGVAWLNNQTNHWEPMPGTGEHYPRNVRKLIEYQNMVVATSFCSYYYSSYPLFIGYINSYMHNGDDWAPMFSSNCSYLHDLLIYKDMLIGVGGNQVAGNTNLPARGEVSYYAGTWMPLTTSYFSYSDYNYNNNYGGLLTEGEVLNDILYVSGWFDNVDGKAISHIAKLDGNLLSFNQPPVAQSEYITVSENGYGKQLNVKKNDHDPDPADTVLTVHIVKEATKGFTFLYGSKKDSVWFLPYHDKLGRDTIIYKVCDEAGDCDTAAVFINIINTNNAPYASNKTFSTQEELSLTMNITEGAYDPDGDSITTFRITKTDHGKTTILSFDSVLYEPNKDFTGTDQIEYQVCDDYGACGTGFVNINVENIYDQLMGRIDTIHLKEDKSVKRDYIQHVDTPEPDEPYYKIIFPVNFGKIETIGSGYKYKPDQDFFGWDFMQIEYCDDQSFCDTSIVYFDVQPVNDRPFANTDTLILKVNETGSVYFMANDDDVDGTFSFDSVLTGSEHGSYNIDDNFLLTYNPDKDFEGIDKLVYSIKDNEGLIDNGTILFFVGVMTGTGNTNETPLLSIIPNPSTGKIMITYTPERLLNAELKIVDVMGRNVYSTPVYLAEPRKPIDVSFLNPGVYLLSVLSNEKLTATKPLIISK